MSITDFFSIKNLKITDLTFKLTFLLYQHLNHIVHADVFSVVKIKMCVIAVNSLYCLTVLG